MNAPTVQLHKTLAFDMDFVDDSCYMFDRQCVGCLILAFSDDMLPNGTVLLNGKPHEDWTFGSFYYLSHPVLIVRVRGYLREYDAPFTLTVRDFAAADGRVMEEKTFALRTLPRRRSSPEFAAQDAFARRVAAESTVLLKNEGGVLPLKEDAFLNFFGRGYSEYRTCAAGAARINPRTRRSIWQAVEEESGFTLNRELHEHYVIPRDDLPDEAVLRRAREQSDVALFVISRGAGENMDSGPLKGEYYLSDGEEAALARLSERFDKIVVILNTAYPVDVRFLEKYKIAACLYTGLGGMCAAEALMDVLSGKADPCACLTDTWPLDYFDSPTAPNFIQPEEGKPRLQTGTKIWSRVCYEEGLYVGYRYYTTFGVPCAFPFGFGLSYTDFVLDGAALTEQERGVSLSVRVRNAGARAGRKVVQFYVRKSEARFEQPAVELCEFGKTRLLAPGEEETLTAFVPLERLASFDEANARWLLSEGEYGFFFGENAAKLTDIGTVTVEEARVIRQSRHALPPTRPVRELSKHDDWRPDGSATFLTEEPQVAHYETFTRLPAEAAQTEGTLTFADVMADPDRAAAFAAQLSDEQLCRLCVSRFQSVWEMDIKGYAGRVAAPEGTDLPEYTLCDGNSGIILPIQSVGFPATAMIASSFDRELIRGVGAVMAEEARRLKVNCILGPGMNLHRDLLNGRHPEYLSEDPFLAGEMAGWQVKGLQEEGVSACIKHVAANNCESVRARSDSEMSERTLREMYLRPFAYAMAVEPADTIMTGYNALNGHFPDENEDLIEGLFFDEMGFDGIAMCDWGSYSSSDSVAMMKAGMNLLTPGADDDSVTGPLLTAMREGRLSRGVMVRNAARIIRMEARRLAVRNNREG